MKVTQSLLLAALCLVLASAIPVEKRCSDHQGKSTKTGKGKLVLPPKCLVKNNIAVGWIPDEDKGFNPISSITDKIGSPACFYGLYSHFSADLSVSNSDILGEKLADVKKSGAIAILSMQPTNINMGQIDANLAKQVAAVCKKYTDQGITVYLRFAHEANLYVKDGTYIGTASDFKKAWGIIANAVKDNDKIFMYWSPNIDSVEAIAQWYPEDSTVDIVGVDAYAHSTDDHFDTLYKSFYDAFSVNKNNKPFVIGETGTLDGKAKGPFYKELVTQTKYPNYVGFSWFELNKPSEGDFRIVTGDKNIAKEILG